jgi:hypothetical protein
MTDWRSFYESIELTEEEIREAIFEGKVKKYFREKHKQYWEEKENGNTKQQAGKNKKAT